MLVLEFNRQLQWNSWHSYLEKLKKSIDRSYQQNTFLRGSYLQHWTIDVLHDMSTLLVWKIYCGKACCSRRFYLCYTSITFLFLHPTLILLFMTPCQWQPWPWGIMFHVVSLILVKAKCQECIKGISSILVLMSIMTQGHSDHHLWLTG